MLTIEAEENLLKLKELRGHVSAEEGARWQEIKAQFMRKKCAGVKNADAGTRVAAQLFDLVAATREVAQAQHNPASLQDTTPLSQQVQQQDWQALLQQLLSAQNPAEAAPLGTLLFRLVSKENLQFFGAC